MSASARICVPSKVFTVIGESFGESMESVYGGGTFCSPRLSTRRFVKELVGLEKQIFLRLTNVLWKSLFLYSACFWNVDLEINLESFPKGLPTNHPTTGSSYLLEETAPSNWKFPFSSFSPSESRLSRVNNPQIYFSWRNQYFLAPSAIFDIRRLSGSLAHYCSVIAQENSVEVCTLNVRQ